MKHFFTSVAVAALFFLGLIFSAPEAAAATQGKEPFGFKTPQDIIEEAKSYISSDVTDYYCVTYSTSSGYTNYAVYFFRSDTANFTYGSILNDSNNGIWGRPGYASYSAQYVTSTQVKRGQSYSRFSSNDSLYLSYIIGSSITTYYNTVNLVAANASQYNVDKVVEFQDSFFCRSDLDSFTINAAVLPTIKSRFDDVNYYYYTDEYYFEIWVPHDFEHSIANISYIPKRYKYWGITQTYGAGTLIDVSGSSDDSLDVSYADRKAHYTNYKYLRELLYAPSTTNLPVSNDDLISTASVYNIYFDDILAGLQEAYPDYGITFKDLYSNITFNFRSASSGEIVYSQSFDYSEAKGYDSTDSDYVPPIYKDPSGYDTTGDPDPQDVPFEFGLASSYDYDSPPDLPEFDFSASFSSEVVDSTSFIKAFFDRLLDSSGLTGFFIAVLSLSAAGWFVFGNFRG